MNPAYVAGLIDGEGCIHLGTRKGTYRGRVTIGMTEVALPLLQQIRAAWGGSIYRLRPATERWSAAWTWSLQGSQTVPLLTSVLPYLIVKREQALLALKVERIRAALERRPNGLGGIWTDQARAECQTIKDQLHKMNAKGARVQSAEVA